MHLASERDEFQARANVKTQAVSLEEARTVFGDPFLMTFPDPDHFDHEPRYVSIGKSAQGRLLCVTHIRREAQVQVLGSRLASASERRFYEEERA